MPGGHEKPLELQSATELWAPIIGLGLFGGIFISVLLQGTITDGREWTRYVMILLCGGFMGTLAVAAGTPRLLELRRRGEWVPPGTAKRPYLVAFILWVVIGVAGALVVAGVAWVVGFCGV